MGLVCEFVDWIHVIQNRVLLLPRVETVMDFHVSYSWGIS